MIYFGRFWVIISNIYILCYNMFVEINTKCNVEKCYKYVLGVYFFSWRLNTRTCPYEIFRSFSDPIHYLPVSYRWCIKVKLHLKNTSWWQDEPVLSIQLNNNFNVRLCSEKMNSTATFVCIHKLPVHTYVTFLFKNTPVCEKNNHYKQQSMKDNYFNNEIFIT